MHSLIGINNNCDNKPNIVLLHGYGGSSAISFCLSGVIQRLGNKFHIYAIDLPGFGRTVLPATVINHKGNNNRYYMYL